MNSSEPIKEGLLKKYTNLMKGYQKRYFVLYSDMLIYYTSKEKTDEDPKKIHLKCANIVPNRNDTITVNTGTHSFKLKFDTIAEKVDWINALKATQLKCESSDPNVDGIKGTTLETKIYSLTFVIYF